MLLPVPRVGAHVVLVLALRLSRHPIAPLLFIHLPLELLLASPSIHVASEAVVTPGIIALAVIALLIHTATVEAVRGVLVAGIHVDPDTVPAVKAEATSVKECAGKNVLDHHAILVPAEAPPVNAFIVAPFRVTAVSVVLVHVDSHGAVTFLVKARSVPVHVGAVEAASVIAGAVAPLAVIVHTVEAVFPKSEHIVPLRVTIGAGQVVDPLLIPAVDVVPLRVTISARVTVDLVDAEAARVETQAVATFGVALRAVPVDPHIAPLVEAVVVVPLVVEARPIPVDPYFPSAFIVEVGWLKAVRVVPFRVDPVLPVHGDENLPPNVLVGRLQEELRAARGDGVGRLARTLGLRQLLRPPYTPVNAGHARAQNVPDACGMARCALENRREVGLPAHSNGHRRPEGSGTHHRHLLGRGSTVGKRSLRRGITGLGRRRSSNHRDRIIRKRHPVCTSFMRIFIE